MDGKTCGTCQFWVMDAIDLNNLAAPRAGECHHSPPQPVAIPVPGGVQIMVLRPKMPAGFGACGQHDRAEVKTVPAPEG